MNCIVKIAALGLLAAGLLGCSSTQTNSQLNTKPPKTATDTTTPAHHAGFNGKHTSDSRVLAAGGYISGAVSGS